MAPHIITKPTTGELSISLADLVVEKSKKAIETLDRFTIGLSGGSLPKILAADLKNRKDITWEKWEVFFCDERIVPLDHNDSNYLLCKNELFDHVPIPPERIHTINGELVSKIEKVDTEKAAEVAQNMVDDYENQLIKVFACAKSVKFPVFDLLLLGIGPDGHICSLFPRHPLLEEDVTWVAYIMDSPKLPRRRITLTLPVVNHAHTVAFVATGAGKQDTLVEVLNEKGNLPAQLVKPIHGKVYWFLDDEAAAKLNI
ncbi:8051_t:CDS:2 [Acaulospora morrowiae]|uniref:6-phosphogluconolactonase n=1 Tax=Acaulospora morrowiae TaxID=94023 RepID=A0A9N8YQT2_9GLOM|nr:8051_t:CDS:2 [Acaulospora morrowiae]